jgi:hypothetical protein
MSLREWFQLLFAYPVLYDPIRMRRGHVRVFNSVWVWMSTHQMRRNSWSMSIHSRLQKGRVLSQIKSTAAGYFTQVQNEVPKVQGKVKIVNYRYS